MTELNCDDYRGRLHQWCLGVDLDGNPLPPKKVAAFRRYLTNGTRAVTRGMSDVERQRHIEQRKQARLDKFHQLWAELHDCFGLSAEEWTDTEARLRYARWHRRIPRGCSCVTHWRELTRSHKPDFSSRASFYAWGVDRHNEVNAKLGKPLWTG